MFHFPHLAWLGAALGMLLLNGCGNGAAHTQLGSGPDPDPVYNLAVAGYPDLIEAEYIELEKIDKISLFRSSVGHDYSREDAFENKRSMKHYYVPRNDVDHSQIEVYAPVTGRIVRVYPEWAGIQYSIQPDSEPAFLITLFHVTPIQNWVFGDEVSAGQLLGHHVGSQTSSDIAVAVETNNGRQLISVFDVMPDALFQAYLDRGASDRSDFIISKAQRDANPLDIIGFGPSNGDPLPKFYDLVDPVLPAPINN